MFGKRDGVNRRKRATEYGLPKLRHSSMGKQSCKLAAASLILIAAAVAIAYVMRGQTTGFVGGMGILAIVAAILGFRAAMKGFRERERNYLTCRIGIGANGLLLLGLLGVFLGGLTK